MARRGRRRKIILAEFCIQGFSPMGQSTGTDLSGSYSIEFTSLFSLDQGSLGWADRKIDLFRKLARKARSVIKSSAYVLSADKKSSFR